MKRQHLPRTIRRDPRAVVLAVVISGLALGWSCQPEPGSPAARVDLVKWAWLEEAHAILLVTSVEEADPFRTHGRIELSWLDGEGREIYRAFYNASSRANPGPPEAFGVFNLEDDTFESAGINAYMEVSVAGFTFLTESETTRQDGLLSAAWVIRPPDSLVGPVTLRTRVLPKRSDSGEWTPLCTLERVDRRWRVADGLKDGV